MSVLKRSRDDGDIEALAMANCLMLLSRVGDTGRTGGDRVFTCKICNRKFSSFQALGGHRASHKKHRLMAGDLNIWSPSSAAKQKTHECSICGQEFSIGQALGGHMRRHKAATTHEGLTNSGISSQLTEIVTPIKKRSSSSNRVLCLDLNLTPYENDVKLGIRLPLHG